MGRSQGSSTMSSENCWPKFKWACCQKATNLKITGLTEYIPAAQLLRTLTGTER